MIKLLKLVRIVNLFVLLLTQYLVFICLPEGGCFDLPLSMRFLGLMVSSSLIAAAGYVINDYFDIKIDLINKPGRLIVGKSIKRRWAIFLHVAFNVVAIGIGFMLSWRVGLFHAGTAGLLLIYSASLKRKFISGNLLIALLMALGIFVVWLFQPALDLHLVLFYSIFAFLSGIIREVVKDMEDVEGDETFGCRTLPIVFGIYRTKIIAFWIGMIFLLFLAIFSVYLMDRHLYGMMSWILIAVAGPFIYFQFRLWNAHKKEHFTWMSHFSKLVILSGVLSMIFRCI